MKFSKPIVGAVLVAPIITAHAALPTAVTEAVTAMQTDGVTLVGIMAAAGAAVYLLAKLLKRFGVFA